MTVAAPPTLTTSIAYGGSTPREGDDVWVLWVLVGVLVLMGAIMTWRDRGRGSSPRHHDHRNEGEPSAYQHLADLGRFGGGGGT